MVDGTTTPPSVNALVSEYQVEKMKEFAENVKTVCKEFPGRCVIAFIDLDQKLPAGEIVRGLAEQSGIEFGL